MRTYRTDENCCDAQKAKRRKAMREGAPLSNRVPPPAPSHPWRRSLVRRPSAAVSEDGRRAAAVRHQMGLGPREGGGRLKGDGRA